MGTNFYWFGHCRECGHLERIHIGKSSGGWYFNLHVYPGRIENLDEWKERFGDEGSFILNEYTARVFTEEMLGVIQDREGSKDFAKPEQEFLDRNYAEVDSERRLLRFVVGKAHCVGHGDGPWSYIVGEFS